MGSRVLGGCRTLMEAAKAKAKASASASANANTKVTRQGGGITKPVPVSPQLGKFLRGVPQASRSLAIKKVWEHIKLRNLQNPTNKKEICCDEKLKTIFDGKAKVGFLEIAKFLSPHFVKAG